MRKTVLALLVAMLVVAVTAGAANAVTPLRPAPTPPDTDELLILHGAFNYPGYWWDHTDLTAAVQAHPNADPASVEAVHQAIADWDFALGQEFGGLITLTDVSDAYAIVRLAGPAARDVLAKGCSLDIHDSVFPPGKVARSLLAQAEAILHRTAAETFDIYVPRSYADYLWRWLEDAGREYGVAVVEAADPR